MRVTVNTSFELVQVALDTVVVHVQVRADTVLDTNDTEFVLALFWLVDI